VRFRPCIDLHHGKVKQIVGSTLNDTSDDGLLTNFEAVQPAAYYAALYRNDGLEGGHVIMLGAGNDDAAAATLAVYPGGLQLGGGIGPENAGAWLARGAAKVIVTSYVFVDGRFSWNRLRALAAAVGREALVLDLSCRQRDRDFVVTCNRWQTFTDLVLDRTALEQMAEHCSEYLVHAVDVEGRQRGILEPLVEKLGAWTPIPATYAGGVRNLDDVERMVQLSGGRLDVTVGSALDLFGGTGIRYADMVALDRQWRAASRQETTGA
jgi:phosphoribosylformimino-5-aminoimidazole carboxamide ribotide isomerase